MFDFDEEGVRGGGSGIGGGGPTPGLIKYARHIVPGMGIWIYKFIPIGDQEDL